MSSGVAQRKIARGDRGNYVGHSYEWDADDGDLQKLPGGYERSIMAPTPGLLSVPEIICLSGTALT
jgi:hypothetical protein